MKPAAPEKVKEGTPPAHTNASTSNHFEPSANLTRLLKPRQRQDEYFWESKTPKNLQTTTKTKIGPLTNSLEQPILAALGLKFLREREKTRNIWEEKKGQKKKKQKIQNSGGD